MAPNYAILTNRIKSAVIDTFVIVGFMYAATEILLFFDDVPNYVKVIITVFIFLLYEPIFVSLFGQSIGHSYLKIKVVKEDDTQKNISFLIAIVRFLAKSFLGWLSFLTVTTTKKKKAIHDLIANSIVIKID